MEAHPSIDMIGGTVDTTTYSGDIIVEKLSDGKNFPRKRIIFFKFSINYRNIFVSILIF